MPVTAMATATEATSKPSTGRILDLVIGWSFTFEIRGGPPNTHSTRTGIDLRSEREKVQGPLTQAQSDFPEVRCSIQVNYTPDRA
jgi:hypothetical protein